MTAADPDEDYLRHLIRRERAGEQGRDQVVWPGDLRLRRLEPGTPIIDRGPLLANLAEQTSLGHDIFPAASVLAANLRMTDQLTPLGMAASQFALTSNEVERAAGLGTLTSWRFALEANCHVEARLRELTMPSPALSELAWISRSLVGLTDWAVLRSPDNGLLGATSGRPVSAWRRVVSEFVDDEGELPAMVSTGRTNLALLGLDLLTSTDADPGVIAEGADWIESDVVEPWRTARQQVTDDLYVVLAGLDRSLPELLNGAWDDIARNGPAATEKVANCAVEAIDRALRFAAPDEAVRAWHSQNGRPDSEWEGRKNPTHRLRVKYLCRDLPGARDLVVGQVEALGTVVAAARQARGGQARLPG
jgi:hypothetical protein